MHVRVYNLKEMNKKESELEIIPFQQLDYVT